MSGPPLLLRRDRATLSLCECLQLACVLEDSCVVRVMCVLHRNVSEDVGKKRHKKEPAVSQVEFGGDTMKGGRRAKRKREMVTDSEEGEEDEGGASWEGVRKGGGGEDEVHYLLPLKTRGGLVLQPPVPKPNSMYMYIAVRLNACINVLIFQLLMEMATDSQRKRVKMERWKNNNHEHLHMMVYSIWNALHVYMSHVLGDCSCSRVSQYSSSAGQEGGSAAREEGNHCGHCFFPCREPRRKRKHIYV